MADTTDAFDTSRFDPSRFQPDRPVPPLQPSGWGQAFAALPPEDAPPEAWAAIAARLPAATRDARRARRYGPRAAGMALAAGVAACALAVALWWPGRQASPPPVVASSAPAPASVASAAAASTDAASTMTSPPVAAHGGPLEAGVQPDSTSEATDAGAMTQQTAARAHPALPTPARGERPRRRTSPQRPAADAVTLPVERRMAAGATAPPLDTDDAALAHAGRASHAVPASVTDVPAGLSAHTSQVQASSEGGIEHGSGHGSGIGIAGVGPASEAGDGAPGLDALQTRSQQLEYLLGQVRDPSVGTGPGALLAAELDARLARIDTALAAAPADDPASLGALWQARVDALERALAFESRLRALAAEGRGFDGALVGVD